LAFAYRKGPRERHIDVNGVRPLQAVIAEIAVCTRLRWKEGRCVHPVVGGLLARIYAVRIGHIRWLVCHRCQRAVRTRENCEQLGGRYRHDRVCWLATVEHWLAEPVMMTPLGMVHVAVPLNKYRAGLTFSVVIMWIVLLPT